MDDLKQRFLTAFNKLMGDREELIANCRLSQSILCDYSEIDVELERLKCERQNKSLMIETFIKGIESRPLILEEFDDKLWAVVVEKGTVIEM